VYRRADVEQVLRIKHLLLVEGLTLAGARRKLDEEAMPVGADTPVIDELIGRNTRERLTEVKRGLRSILDLLAGRGKSELSGGRHTPAAARSATSLAGGRAQTGRMKASRTKPVASRGSARRKRSA
jgi:hypothetical protein